MTEIQTKKTPTRQQLSPPAGVKSACKTGIKMVEEGMGGSGLEAATVREARAIVRGTPITIAKAKKMVRWWGRNARFLTFDKDSPAWVAALLWGGRAGLSWSRRLKRTFDADEKSFHPNPIKTLSYPTHDMTHEISIEDATIVGDSDFDSKAGKSMPVEIHYRIITPFKIDKAVQEKESDDVKIRGAVYVGGDDMLDRHGELVDSKAIMDAWNKYSKNPVILYNHSKTYGVIGRMTDVSMEEQDGVKMPMGTAIIDGGEKDITRKIRKGMLKAFSIGFIAKAAVKECKDDDSCYMKFTEIDWVETSVVDVPASPDALFSVQKSVMLGVEANMEECDCGDVCCDEKDAESQFNKLDFDATEKHIVRIEEDDQYITVVYGKSEEWEGIDVDTTDAPEEAGYYDEEDDDKKSISQIIDRLESLENKIESDESVNSHLESSKGLMDSEDMDLITEDATATEEESVVVETPELVEDVVIETTEEMMEEKSVEEEIEMPSPREALIDVASALKSIMETLDSMQEKSEVVEEEILDNSEDEITSLKAEIASLKEEKAAREAEVKLEAEVAKRVEERLAEVGVEATPSRKSIPNFASKKTATKTFDPQPKVSNGMNGLAAWLESNIAHRN
jgi:HK97 family phage prohead protease